MNYQELPKIELHCHLDGSMRLETICELGKKHHIDMPTYDPEELKKKYKEIGIVKYDENWHKQKFQLAIDIMKYPQNLKRGVLELLENAANENVKYIEIRFAPRLHVTNDFSLEQILQSFSSGIIEGMTKFNIIANGIICFRSSYDKSDVMDVIKMASTFLDKRIVAVDLVGIETDGFANDFIEEIAYAQKLGFKTTIHSGEMIESKNVEKAINILNTDRIGHGYRIENDQEQINLVLAKNVPIEICLTSNSKRMQYDYTRHPFKKFFDLGIKLSLNTDNRTLSNTNMTKEISKAFEIFNLTENEYRKIFIDSVNASFASNQEKNQLRKIKF